MAAGFVMSSRDIAAMRSRASLGLAGTSVLAPKADTAAASRAAKRKAASDSRAKRWPNTLTALRRRKEMARKVRLDKAEAARRVTDEEEELRRLEERTATLQEAQRMLVHNTDKMKMLRSQQMVVHNGQVRRKQLEHKRRREAAAKERDMEYHKKLMARVAEAEEADRAAWEAEQRKAAEIQAMLHEQLEAAKEAARARAEEERAEGKRVLREARAAAKAEAEAEEARRAEQRRNNEAMLRANEELRKLKAKEAEKLAEEARALQRYKDEKEDVERRRRELVESKRRAAERRAAEMRAIIEGKFMAAMADEGAKLDAQQKAARAKQDAAEAAKEDDRAGLWAEIEASRRAQTDRRRRAREAERAQDAANAAKWGGIIHGLAVEEYEEGMSKRERARRVALENRRRAREHADELLGQEAKERAADEEAVREGTEGDTGFSAAAQQLLEGERRAGRRTDFIERSIVRSLRDPMIPAGADM